MERSAWLDSHLHAVYQELVDSHHRAQYKALKVLTHQQQVACYGQTDRSLEDIATCTKHALFPFLQLRKLNYELVQRCSVYHE